MASDIADNTEAFVLPQVMNIETIEDVITKLKTELLQRRKVMVLDASKVENITTVGLQCIVALDKTLSAVGSAFFIKDESDSFTAAFTDAGLGNLISGRKYNG